MTTSVVSTVADSPVVKAASSTCMVCICVCICFFACKCPYCNHIVYHGIMDLLDETIVYLFVFCLKMGVSKNNGTPKSSILIGFSIINHPFGGTPWYPYFWKHPNLHLSFLGFCGNSREFLGNSRDRKAIPLVLQFVAPRTAHLCRAVMPKNVQRRKGHKRGSVLGNLAYHQFSKKNPRSFNCRFFFLARAYK